MNPRASGRRPPLQSAPGRACLLQGEGRVSAMDGQFRSHGGEGVTCARRVGRPPAMAAERRPYAPRRSVSHYVIRRSDARHCPGLEAQRSPPHATGWAGDQIIASARAGDYCGVRRRERRGDAPASALASPDQPRGSPGVSPGMQDEISRRSFLRATGVAGAAVAVGEAAPGGTPTRPSPPRAGSTARCAGRSSRWSRTTRAQFDPQFWLDYFRRTTADAACLSAGGCVAYYPTKVPLPPPQPVAAATATRSASWSPAAASSAWSSSRAPTRTPPTTTSSDAHPDWIAVDADGQPRRHWASPEMWVTCALGPVQLRVHDRGAPRDRDALQGRRHLHQPLGRLRACATASTAGRTSGPRPGTTCRARTTRRTRRGGRTSSGSRSGSSSSGGSGTARSGRSIPTRASSRTPAAARRARST